MMRVEPGNHGLARSSVCIDSLFRIISIALLSFARRAGITLAALLLTLLVYAGNADAEALVIGQSGNSNVPFNNDNEYDLTSLTVTGATTVTSVTFQVGQQNNSSGGPSGTYGTFKVFLRVVTPGAGSSLITGDIVALFNVARLASWGTDAPVTVGSLSVNVPAGQYRVLYQKTGGGNFSSRPSASVTLSPPPLNQAPVANAGPDQSVASGAAPVTLDGTGSSDPDAQAITYLWSQTSGPSVTLSSTTVASPTFTAPTLAIGDPDATLVFSLTVNDGLASSPADTVTITVQASGSSVDVPVIEAFDEVTSAFIARRIDRLLSSEPLAYRLERRRNGGRMPEVSMRASGNTDHPAVSLEVNADFISDDQRWYIWSEGEYSNYTDDTGSLRHRQGEFGVLYIGADYLVNEDFALGILVQADTGSERITSFSEVSGNGWMVGPYITMEISPDLFFSARAAWGRSENSASVDVFEVGNIFTGDFQTERTLVRASLLGTYDMGQLQVSPDAELAYMRERQENYLVSDGLSTVSVAGGTAEIGRLSVSVSIDYPVAMGGGTAILFTEPSFDWNFYSTGAGDALERIRGSLEMGVRTDVSSDWQGEFSIRYDGIGEPNFNAVSVRALIELEF